MGLRSCSYTAASGTPASGSRRRARSQHGSAASATTSVSGDARRGPARGSRRSRTSSGSWTRSRWSGRRSSACPSAARSPWTWHSHTRSACGRWATSPAASAGWRWTPTARSRTRRSTRRSSAATTRRRWRSTSPSGRPSAPTRRSASCGGRRPRREAYRQALARCRDPMRTSGSGRWPCRRWWCSRGMIRPSCAPPGRRWRAGCRARLVEVDSDHYLTLREPDRLVQLLLDFLGAAARPQQ
ncbi:MAG: hypothetical protein V7644_2636 [Actinomycetota bacterium]